MHCWLKASTLGSRGLRDKCLGPSKINKPWGLEDVGAASWGSLMLAVVWGQKPITVTIHAHVKGQGSREKVAHGGPEAGQRHQATVMGHTQDSLAAVKSKVCGSLGSSKSSWSRISFSSVTQPRPHLVSLCPESLCSSDFIHRPCPNLRSGLSWFGIWPKEHCTGEVEKVRGVMTKWA